MKDRPAAKDLASFAKQLQQLDATPEEVGTIKLLPSDGLLWDCPVLKIINRGRSCSLPLLGVVDCQPVRDSLAVWVKGLPKGTHAR